ncbi:MAG: response regulator, partial [Chloroflexota bacterium]
LGLTITKRLVSMMGSELQVESRVGEGSKFWFDITLPLIDAPEPTVIQSLPDIIDYQGERRRVLIVDDRPENLWVLRNMLEPLGFTILEATNGLEAIEKAKNGHLDLILMDIAMPGMDGLEATRHVRHKLALHDLVIIAVSAKAYEEDQEQSLAAGCNAFLSKPVNEAELMTLIAAHLNITWKYEIEDKQEDDGLIVPPGKLLQKVYDFAYIGRIQSIHKEIDQIEQLGDQYRPFAQKLRDLAEMFEDEQIVELVEPYLSTEE